MTADYRPILMPIIRRLPSLTDSVIDSQQMTAPTGQIYSWKAVYKEKEKKHNRNGANSE